MSKENGSSNKPPMFQPSIDTQMIEERLRNAEIGEVVGYEELSQIVGRDVRTAVYHCLQSARKRMEKDGIIFGTVEKVGVKRLTDAEIVKLPSAATLRVRRIATRTVRQLAGVQKFEELAPADRVAHNMGMSMFGALRLMTGTREVKKLSEVVAQAGGKLPTAKTLELFAKS